jgi:hypothetical protein
MSSLFRDLRALATLRETFLFWLWLRQAVKSADTNFFPALFSS